MSTVQKAGGRLAIAGLVLGFLTFGRSAEAQVGIQSGLAKVDLVARSLPHGSLEAWGGEGSTRRVGTLREGTLTLRISTNHGYSLVVRGTPQARAARTWVRSAAGEFQEVTPGSPVTVARDQSGNLNLEQAVEYRVESTTAGEPAGLPVSYELRIAPTL